MLAPREVRVRHCPGNALPFCVEWEGGDSRHTFFGLTPDEAANEALRAIRRGSVPPPAPEHATTPQGDGDYVEAVREWIDSTERSHPTRPPLRLVGDPEPPDNDGGGRAGSGPGQR